MNDHTKKVAKAGFAWLTILSAVVLSFPLAFQILPQALQENAPFRLAYSFVSVFWMMAIAFTGIRATINVDSRALREYYDSLPPSGGGDDDDGDGEDEEDDGEDDDVGEGDDDDVEWESDDASEPGLATWKDPATGETRRSDAVPATTGESANSLATSDSGFVRADSIKPNPHQTGIQVFRVPGGTLKPGM